jgi:hypothetical protein
VTIDGEVVEISNSRYISVSENPNISSQQFSGELLVIDRNKLPPGTEYISNAELLEMGRQADPPPSEYWFRNQTQGSALGPPEMEGLVSPSIPPEAITPEADLPRVQVPNPPAVMPTTGVAGWIGRNGTTVGRIGTGVGIAFTAIDLVRAGQRSYDRGDWRPFAGEVVRQGFTWGGSLLGGRLGAAAGVAIGGGSGTAGGPAAPATVPAGAVIGGFLGGVFGSVAGGVGGRWVGNQVVDWLGWN